MNIKCDCCGKFINPMEAKSEYVPESEYTTESITWICKRCNEPKATK